MTYNEVSASQARFCKKHRHLTHMPMHIPIFRWNLNACVPYFHNCLNSWF